MIQLLNLSLPKSFIEQWLTVGLETYSQGLSSCWDSKGIFLYNDSYVDESGKSHTQNFSLMTSKESLSSTEDSRECNLVLQVYQHKEGFNAKSENQVMSLALFGITNIDQSGILCADLNLSGLSDITQESHIAEEELDESKRKTSQMKSSILKHCSKKKGRPPKKGATAMTDVPNSSEFYQVVETERTRKYMTRGIKLPLEKWGLTGRTNWKKKADEDKLDGCSIVPLQKSSGNETFTSDDHDASNVKVFRSDVLAGKAFRIDHEMFVPCTSVGTYDLEGSSNKTNFLKNTQEKCLPKVKSDSSLGLKIGSCPSHEFFECDKQKHSMPESKAKMTDFQEKSDRSGLNYLILKVAKSDSNKTLTTFSSENTSPKPKNCSRAKSRLIKQLNRKKVFQVKLDGLPNRKRRARNSNKCVGCKYCQRLFCDYTGVHEHVKKYHSDEADFGSHLAQLKFLKQTKCDICEKTFMDRYSLHHHQNKEHSDVEEIKCPHCPEVFDNPVTLRTHVRTSHVIPPKRFSCMNCPAVFKWSSSLKAHELEIHKGMREKSCGTCGKFFHRQSQLNRHMKVHSSEAEKLNCTICHCKFNFKANLKRHLAIVHGPQEETFHCSYCGRGFAQKASLWPHIQNIHFPIQIFSCDKCKKTFSYYQAFKSHMAKVHKDTNMGVSGPKSRMSKYLKTTEDLFYCSACKEPFFYKSLLFEHMHTAHADAFPFQCKECHQGFLDRNFLIIHKHKAHDSLLTEEEATLLRVSDKPLVFQNSERNVGCISQLGVTAIQEDDIMEDNLNCISMAVTNSKTAQELCYYTTQVPAATTSIQHYNSLEEIDSSKTMDSAGNLADCEMPDALYVNQLENKVAVSYTTDLLEELGGIEGAEYRISHS